MTALWHDRGRLSSSVWTSAARRSPPRCATLDGRRLGTVDRASSRDLGAHESFERGVRGRPRAARQRPSPGADLVAVGACTFGIPFDDRVELAPTIPGLERAGVRSAAARGVPRGRGQGSDGRQGGRGGRGALGLAGRLRPRPVRQPRHRPGGGARRRRPGRHRQPRRGRRDRVQPAPARPTSAARLGDRVPLEDRVSGLALSRQATRRRRPADARRRRVRHARGRPGRPARCCSEFVAELCFHVVNLAIALDPARVAVGGGMVRSWDVIGTALERALDAAVAVPARAGRRRLPARRGADGCARARGRGGTAGSRADNDAHGRGQRPGTERHGRQTEGVAPLGSTGEGQSR